MNQNIRKKLETYKETQEDTHGNGMYSHRQKAFQEDNPFMPGIVTDNRDPECLGRVRVQLDLLSPGCVSPWYPMGGRWTGGGQGLWSLPDIGTQVLVAFPDGDKSHGIVLGCLYDEKHFPPETSPEKKSDSMLLQTRNHRIEITDDAGKEGISIESAAGKMRCVLDKKNGIQIENELGDIKINCRKLKTASGNNVELNGKKVSVSCDGATGTKSGKETKITCDKNVGMEGKNIKLNGSSGVCAEGKQMAAQDDRVMGMDVHIMVIPSGPSTTTAPLPHPFMGKLDDGLSDDVSIGDKKAALKGSKAKHDDSMHMQLPGTIKFQNNPKKEGEVTGGTSPTVKINGKETAVIGSLVTTCNDIGARNNSTVIAAGAGMPMPAIINPSNTEEFERERREQENREPRFSDVKWSAATVAEGEEAELTAGVQDIADGNMVSLLVFPEGKGPENSVPIASFPCTVKGGSVSAQWSHRANRSVMPPEKNPRFIFTAHCAWCNFEKSSNTLEVRLARPEITKAEWRNSDKKNITKEKIDNKITLYAETKDIDDGKTVTFEIFESLQNPSVESPQKTLFASVLKGNASVEFNFNDLMPPPKIDEALYRYYKERGEDIPREQFEFLLDDYDSEIDSPYKEKPKFIFIAKSQKCKELKSENLELSKDITVTVLDAGGNGEKDAKVYLKEPNGKEHKFICGEDGIATFEDLIPGNYNVKIERKRKEK
nr:MAG TPA: baseplate assembly protein [Caudoviricetes sp.]